MLRLPREEAWVLGYLGASWYLSSYMHVQQRKSGLSAVCSSGSRIKWNFGVKQYKGLERQSGMRLFQKEGKGNTGKDTRVGDDLRGTDDVPVTLSLSRSSFLHHIDFLSHFPIEEKRPVQTNTYCTWCSQLRRRRWTGALYKDPRID